MIRFSITIIAIVGLFFVFTQIDTNADDSLVPVGNVAVVTDAGKTDDENINFSWKDAEGNSQSLSDHRGKVVLINFWATWCVPCRKEIPELIEINNELDENVFTLIGISVDQISDINKVDGFINDQNVNYLNVLDDGRITRQFGNIRAIPTTIILDKEGNIKETIIGIRSKNQFLEKINQYL